MSPYILNKSSVIIFCKRIILFGFFILPYILFSQNNNYEFISKIKKGNYYFLKGNIDGKYEITMQLNVHHSAFCGEEWKAIQWRNGKIDGWYKYDKYGEKIDLIGSYHFENEVKIYVPDSPNDTIGIYTCEMEKYREIFLNENNYDLTNMKWKMWGNKKFKKVELNILHKPEPDTILILFKNENNLTKEINVKDLMEANCNNVKVISFSKNNDDYHLLFKLEYMGWREYQSYIGHLILNENMELKNHEIHLKYNSWNGEEEELIYDEAYPEKGVKIKDK